AGRQARRMAVHPCTRRPLRTRTGAVMSVIDSYLETLFSPYPGSPRMQEAKVELRAMMEGQYQGLREDGLTESQALGKVIAEFGSLEEVSSVLGIDREIHGGPAGSETAEPMEHLTLERMREYTAAVRGSQLFSALAVPRVVLCTGPPPRRPCAGPRCSAPSRSRCSCCARSRCCCCSPSTGNPPSPPGRWPQAW